MTDKEWYKPNKEIVKTEGEIISYPRMALSLWRNGRG